MPKRKNEGKSADKKSKKPRAGLRNIEANWSGIYVTCIRGKEAQCRGEMINVLSEYTEDLPEVEDDLANDSDDDGKSDDDIEASIAKEVAALKSSKKTSRIIPIDVNCECVLFFRTKKPIDPVDLVIHICKDTAETGQKKSRYAQRLTPITCTETANLEGLKRLCEKVLSPHFHSSDGQKPLKFAIRPSLRNHNTMDRDEIIRTVASAVGTEYGHSVDLKSYDKLILVECFKSSVGMAVVDNSFEKYDRFNLHQIFEKAVGLSNKGRSQNGEKHKQAQKVKNKEDKKEVLSNRQEENESDQQKQEVS